MMSQDGIAEEEALQDDPIAEESGPTIADHAEFPDDFKDMVQNVVVADDSEASAKLDAEIEEILADNDDAVASTEGEPEAQENEDQDLDQTAEGAPGSGEDVGGLDGAEASAQIEATPEFDPQNETDVVGEALGSSDETRSVTTTDEITVEESAAAADDSPESYQSHFLDEESDEPEFVAHVEDRPEPKRRSAKTALTAVGERSVPWVPPKKSPGAAADLAFEIPDDVPAEFASVEPASSSIDEPSTPATSRSGARISDDLFLSAILSTGGRRKSSASADTQPDGIESAGDEVLASSVDYESEVKSETTEDADADEPDAWDETEPAEPVSLVAEAPDPEEDEDAVQSSGGGFWTIPLVCVGVAIIACCVIFPQIEANRRLAYERAELRRDLESVQAQVSTNDDFLRKLAGDPTLAERLAQRQMKLMRPGTRILPVGQGDDGTSPFDLIQVTPPPALEPYQPLGGRLAMVCSEPRSRLYWMAGGLFVLAAGLVLGAGGKRVS